MGGIAPKALGERIVAERRARGMSQQTLARAVGVTQQYIAKIESGGVCEPGHWKMRRITEILNISLNEVGSASTQIVDCDRFDPADGEDEQQIVHRFAELARRRWNADAIMLLRTREGEVPEGIYGLDTIRLNTLRKPAVLA